MALLRACEYQVRDRWALESSFSSFSDEPMNPNVRRAHLFCRTKCVQIGSICVYASKVQNTRLLREERLSQKGRMLNSEQLPNLVSLGALFPTTVMVRTREHRCQSKFLPFSNFRGGVGVGVEALVTFTYRLLPESPIAGTVPELGSSPFADGSLFLLLIKLYGIFLSIFFFQL